MIIKNLNLLGIKKLVKLNFIDIERLIHSIKTVIACIIGIFCTKLLGFAADQWVVITILVVMCAQIYVGSVFQKSYLRFLGTVIGCLIAIITLYTLGNSLFAVTITVALAGFFFSYIATGNENLTYACTLGAATTAIIMLGKTPTISYAGARFLDISIGLLIATLISQFVLPIHARTHLRRLQAKTLGQLREYYSAYVMTQNTETEALRYQELDEAIAKSLMKQRQLAKESTREPFGSSFDPKQYVQFLQCEKEILRAIDFMHNALMKMDRAEAMFTYSAIQLFNEDILKTFDKLIEITQSHQTLESELALPSLISSEEEIKKTLVNRSQEEVVYIDGFLFGAELLADSLLKLGNLSRTAL